MRRSRPEIPPHARCNDQGTSAKERSSRLTIVVPEAYLPRRSSWPSASVRCRTRRKRGLLHTLRNGSRNRSRFVSADHLLNFTAAVLSSPRSSDGHHVVDSGARLALVKALASLDPRTAGFGLDESLGRAQSWHLRDGRREFRSSTEVRCGNERLRQADD